MKHKIVLYSTGCPRCEVLKNKLANKKIDYTENNSTEEMLALGISQVPMLWVDGDMYAFKGAVDWVNQYEGD